MNKFLTRKDGHLAVVKTLLSAFPNTVGEIFDDTVSMSHDSYMGLSPDERTFVNHKLGLTIEIEIGVSAEAPAPKADERTKYGVVVGRFQVHELHAGHHKLLTNVSQHHPAMIVVLGVSPVKGSSRNPVPFVARMRMIQEAYPKAIVIPQNDSHCNQQWVSNLHKALGAVTGGEKVTLYGSRDSFINIYEANGGFHPTFEIEPEGSFSGTFVRNQIDRDFLREASPNDKAFRAGLISATLDRYPTCYPTVDILPIDYAEGRVMLARKPGETGWRMIGGFCDPSSESLEANAARELVEEAGINVTASAMKYHHSFVVDDWRYRRERDKILTSVFTVELSSVKDVPKASDDIEEASWFPFDAVCGSIGVRIPLNPAHVLAICRIVHEASRSIESELHA